MAKVGKCTSVQELAEYFQTKTTATEHCIYLQEAAKDPNRPTNKILQRLWENISDSQAVISSMREEINSRKKVLASIQEMRVAVAYMQEQLNAAKSNLPARLPVPTPVSNGYTENKNNMPIEQNINAHSQPASANAATKNQRPKKGKTIPSISYLTVQEYDSVPKYIKGRLTYDKMNTAVDDANSTIHAKYTLINTKRSAQNDYIRGKIISYKEEETKETQGCHYFTEKDAKELGKKKVDAAFRSVLTILRHCKRIKEVRGGGLTRFVLCN